MQHEEFEDHFWFLKQGKTRKKCRDCGKKCQLYSDIGQIIDGRLRIKVECKNYCENCIGFSICDNFFLKATNRIDAIKEAKAIITALKI